MGKRLTGTSALLTLYRGTGYLLGPALNLLLDRRTKRGKEERSRRPERFGIPSRQRPEGPLVWVHAASVGETYAALPVIREITGRGLNVLLTTGTVTSAEIARDQLPERAVHQYVPFDTEPYIRSFLDAWSPDLALLIESEIWPLTLTELGDRSIPVVVLNGHISTRSVEHWQRVKTFANQVFSNIDLCLAQSERDATLYARLGVVAAKSTGNLKFDRDPPTVDEPTLEEMRALIGDRPVWIAASTHPGEEEVAIAAHSEILKQASDGLLILAPRHPQRGEEVAALVREAGLPVAVRSKAEVPDAGTAVYLADTIGDLGLLYRLADAAFVGGSFAERGGQSPVEPAQLGVPVLHGPRVRNFKDIYRDLNEAQGAVRCETEADFRQAIGSLLFDADKCRSLAENAETYVMGQRGALTRTLEALTPFLEATAARVTGKLEKS